MHMRSRKSLKNRAKIFQDEGNGRWIWYFPLIPSQRVMQRMDATHSNLVSV